MVVVDGTLVLFDGVNGTVEVGIGIDNDEVVVTTIDTGVA